MRGNEDKRLLCDLKGISMTRKKKQNLSDNKAIHFNVHLTVCRQIFYIDVMFIYEGRIQDFGVREESFRKNFASLYIYIYIYIYIYYILIIYIYI